MKRPLRVLIVLLSFVVLFVLYENFKVKNEIELAWEFSANATEQARQNNSTTKEFYTQYSSLGDLESDYIMSNPVLVLVQNVRLSGFICPKYTVRIFYSSGGSDGGNLTSVSGKRHGILCFL